MPGNAGVPSWGWGTKEALIRAHLSICAGKPRPAPRFPHIPHLSKPGRGALGWKAASCWGRAWK